MTRYLPRDTQCVRLAVLMTGDWDAEAVVLVLGRSRDIKLCCWGRFEFSHCAIGRDVQHLLGGHGKNGMYQTIRTLFKIWILSRLDGVSSNHNAVLPYIKMAIQRPNSYTPFNGTLEIKNESYDEPK